jgi:hypothetical protein
MQKELISRLVGLLITNVLTKELIILLTKNVIIFIEEHVKGTASEVDDAIAIPICNMLRSALNIPD